MNCPHCGRKHEVHDGPSRGAKPKSGDASLCWGCGGIAVYVLLDGNLTLRLPTAQEDAEIQASPQVRETRAAIAESYTPGQASRLRWGPS